MQDIHLEKAIAELASREREFIEAQKDFPGKKHEYKLKFACAIKQADGTEKVKEATAVQITSREYREFLEAEARLEIAKTLLYDVKSVIEARRSLLSNEKSERDFVARGNSAGA